MDDDPGKLESVQVDFALAVGNARLDASVVVPSGSVTLTQILPALRGLSSNIVGAVVELVEAEGRRISCKAGCGACCRQMVPLSVFEAEALGAWIHGLPEEAQKELRDRFHAALLLLKERGILDRLDPEQWVDGNEQAMSLASDYLAAKVPCPFLINESCGIHPIRPVICREYLVTSPPEYCVLPTPNTVTGVSMPLKISQGLFRMGAQIEKGGRGWIPLVFLFAWMDCGAMPGEQFRGPGPEVLHEFVKAMMIQPA